MIYVVIFLNLGRPIFTKSATNSGGYCILTKPGALSTPSLLLFSPSHPFTCPLPSSSPSPSQTEQLRLFPEPVWAVAAEAEVSQAVTPCQRLVEETERVGEEGGGKFSSSSTATPTLLRRVNMQEAATHLLLRGLYFSMELRLELPSLPPTAYNQPSIATRSWVLLEGEKKIAQPYFLIRCIRIHFCSSYLEWIISMHSV